MVCAGVGAGNSDSGSGMYAFASKRDSVTRYRSAPKDWLYPSGNSKGRPGLPFAMSSFEMPLGPVEDSLFGPGQTCTTHSLNSVKVRSSNSFLYEASGALSAGKVL